MYPTNTRKKTRLRLSGYNFEPQFEDNEMPYGVSETVPDQSMSLQDLLQRHLNGISLPVQKTPIWTDNMGHDSADLSKLKDLDPFEKQQVQEQIQSNFNKAKNSLEKLDKAAKEKQKKEAAKEKPASDASNDLPKTDPPAPTVV